MVIVSEKEKEIYNSFLRISRGKKGEPFRYRKQWNDWHKKPESVSVKKIKNFLDKFPFIKLEDYLEAPYVVISNDETFNLEFYCSQNAIKTYTAYVKKQDDQDCDDNTNFTFIKNSIIFFYSYCNRNNIKTYKEYFNKKEISLPVFLKHYKERKLSIYFLLYIGLEKYLEQFATEEREYLFPELQNKLAKYKNNMMLSKKSIKFLDAAMPKILEKLACKLSNNEAISVLQSPLSGN